MSHVLLCSFNVVECSLSDDLLLVPLASCGGVDVFSLMACGYVWLIVSCVVGIVGGA